MSGVMFGTGSPSGPFGVPPRNRVLSVAMRHARAACGTRRSGPPRAPGTPRAPRPRSARVGGGVSRGAKAASQAGRNTLSNSGTRDLLRRVGAVHRRDGPEEGDQGPQVLLGHAVEHRVRVHRDQPLAVRPPAEADRGDDLLIRPAADPRLLVGRDVRGVDGAERPVVLPSARCSRASPSRCGSRSRRSPRTRTCRARRGRRSGRLCAEAPRGAVSPASSPTNATSSSVRPRGPHPRSALIAPNP